MGTSYKIQLLNPLNSLQNGSYKEPCSGLDPSPFCSGYFDEDYISIYILWTFLSIGEIPNIDCLSWNVLVWMFWGYPPDFGKFRMATWASKEFLQNQVTLWAGLIGEGLRQACREELPVVRGAFLILGVH